MDKAKAQYAATLEKAPNAFSAHMALGMIYEGEKDFKKAQEHYEKALKINPNFAPAANNLAYILAEHGGNIDVALNLAQKAKEQVPDDPHISDTLGWIYYKKNVPGRAVAYLKEAVEKVPDQPVVRYHLGMAYYKNGNRDLAKKELNEALRLDARFQGADEARATLGALK
jgi:Flp pilus assembly protein TadD